MAHQKTERNPLFAGRWFDDDIILLCLRWYFRFKLSYRDLVAILGERAFAMPKPAKSVGSDSRGRWVGAGELMKHSSRFEAR